MKKKDGDPRNRLDGTLNWKYTWQTPPYVITLSTQNIERKAFEHISTLKRKISAFTRWMAKCFNHATGALYLSLSLPHFRWAHSLSLRFPVYNYFCICAVELELRSLYLCENLAYLVCDSMAVGMHVSYSCLHAPIKIVIQVNFESKNINKCHPFSHILCLFSSKYARMCIYICCGMVGVRVNVPFSLYICWQSRLCLDESFSKCNYTNVLVPYWLDTYTLIHSLTHTNARIRIHASWTCTSD